MRSSLPAFGFVAFALLLGSSGIGQTQTSEVRGSIESLDTGTPISDAVVALRRTSGQVMEAVSDVAGRFLFEGIPPGRYTVEATRSGYKRPRGMPALDITLGAGQDLRDVGLKLVAEASVSGVIRNEDGTPPSAGLVIRALAEGYEDGRRTVECIGSPAPVEESGSFRIAGLVPGTYYLAVNGCRFNAAYYPGVSEPADAIPVTLIADTEVFVDFTLPSREAYRVTLDIEPPLTTRDDGSVNAAMRIVRLSRSGVRIVDSLESIRLGRSLEAEGRGSYRLTQSLPSGSYEIYVGSNAASIQVGSAAFTIEDRDVHAGTVIMPSVMRLAGQVDVAGLPQGRTALASLRVRLRAMDGRSSASMLIVNQGGAGMRVDADDGTFIFERVAAGHYEVEVGGMPRDSYLSEVRYGARDVMSDGLMLGNEVEGPLRLTLALGGAVSGVVRKERDDEPAAGSLVALIPPSDRWSRPLFRTARTDQRGGFFMTGVAPGAYTVLAWESILPGAWENQEFLRRFQAQAVDVTVEAGLQTTTEMRVIPAGN